MKVSEPRSCIPVPKIEDDCYDWYARHAAKVAAVGAGRFEIVMIGDSLTHFWNGEDGPDYGEGCWNEYFGGRAVLNLGFGFDRTQNVLWRLGHGELAGQSPRLVILNIGTNQFSVSENYSGDSPEVAVAGISRVAATLLAGFPDAGLVVMKLFPRAGLGGRIAGTNALLDTALPRERRIAVLDIGERLGFSPDAPRPECYRDDGCHLARPGYEIWYNALKPYLRFE